MIEGTSSILLSEAEVARVAILKRKLALFMLMVFLAPFISLVLSGFYVRSQDVCCSTTTHTMMQTIDLAAPGIAEFIKQKIKWQPSFSGVYLLISWNVSLLCSILSLPILFYVIKHLGLEYYVHAHQGSKKELSHTIGREIAVAVGAIFFAMLLILILYFLGAPPVGERGKFNDGKLSIFVPIAVPAIQILILVAAMQFKKAFLIREYRKPK
jgi:cbb3-type cytochrome oxidase subunit 3